jgi:hypothetical protein
MATAYEKERSPEPGRRMTDAEREKCAVHEEDIDAINKELAKQAGWFKASAGFLTVAVTVLGWFLSIIIADLSAIKSMLSRTDVVIERHTQQILTLDARIDMIEKRHQWIDQNQVTIRKGR